jgi:hypothetical protein
MRIEAGVGDLVQRTANDQAQVEYSVAERLRSWVMLCAVCTVHKETRSAGFLVQLQNQGRGFLPICLKTSGYGSCGLASELLTWVSQFASSGSESD